MDRQPDIRASAKPSCLSNPQRPPVILSLSVCLAMAPAVDAPVPTRPGEWTLGQANQSQYLFFLWYIMKTTIHAEPYYTAN